MKARPFVRISFFLSLASWIALFAVMRIACAKQDAMLYGMLSLFVAIMCGVYKYYANTIMDPEASLSRTQTERQLALITLFLPSVLALFSAFSILCLHASIAKVGWTIFACAARSGITYAEECRYGEHRKK